MKASQAVARLQALIEERGDLELRTWNDVEGEFDQVNEIEPRRVLPGQRGTDAERAVAFFGIDTYSMGDTSAQLRYDGTEFSPYPPPGPGS